MKIAAITTSSIPSSTANSIQAMKAVHALAQVAGPVCLWVPGHETTPWPDLARHYGISTPFEVRWETSRRVLKRYDFALQSVNHARAWGAELVYTWTLQAAVLALWQHLPVTLEIHDLPSGQFGPLLFSRFVSSAGKKRLLVITEALRAKLEQIYRSPLPPTWVQIAPNGTDPDRYSGLATAAQVRQELNLPLDRPLAAYSGHFYAGRGTDLLVGLAQRLPQVHFLWVGGHPEDVSRRQQWIDEQHIHNITLTGFIDNQRLPLYQAAADVLLMPYERKIAGSSGGNSADICSPMKMFDYLAAGKAILSSDLPVIHEVLNESNAVFCPPDDLEAWCAALEHLLQQPDFMSQLGKQARLDAEKYTWRGRAERALGITPNPDSKNIKNQSDPA